jgi:diacylglycerol kinase (ATP)
MRYSKRTVRASRSSRASAPSVVPGPAEDAKYAAAYEEDAERDEGAETPLCECGARQREAAQPPGEQKSVTAGDLPFNPYKGNRGLTRAWHAMKYSVDGFRVAIREESAFRQELTLAVILIPIGVIVPVVPVARVLLLGSVVLVLIVELLNSSVEAAVDRISLERHELSRRAKDLGSAAVMLALGMCLMTWVLIVGPLVWR